MTSRYSFTGPGFERHPRARFPRQLDRGDVDAGGIDARRSLRIEGVDAQPPNGQEHRRSRRDVRRGCPPGSYVVNAKAIAACNISAGRFYSGRGARAIIHAVYMLRGCEILKSPLSIRAIG